MLVRNGKTPLGWRLDELSEENVGIGMLLNPFAIVPKQENADRIVAAFDLLKEWTQTPFFEKREDWEAWVKVFRAKVDILLGAK